MQLPNKETDTRCEGSQGGGRLNPGNSAWYASLRIIYVYSFFNLTVQFLNFTHDVVLKERE